MPANEPVTGVKHPAPHRSEVSGKILVFAIVAAPVVWSLQVLLGYALSSHACFPREYPLAVLPQGWGGLPHALLAVTAVAFVIAAAASFMGYRSWRKTAGEAGGGHKHLIEVGEGRTRFMAAWGLWIGALFAVALIFDALGLYLVSSCGG